ncbi:hypothetical protein ANACOL_02337 [Anaerotruncus colihominis DSM 17241]|uniref:Uncharacterized protein n=1 Tax=Anaerotruncus colihominis DSM 17241 TaxID=445972 RepID=B0PC28_9FIRM|nr:hypothetical protein ANACOL_02337 [Anaerotruncus colihominis DSM 17241]
MRLPLKCGGEAGWYHEAALSSLDNLSGNEGFFVVPAAMRAGCWRDCFDKNQRRIKNI